MAWAGRLAVGSALLLVAAGLLVQGWVMTRDLRQFLAVAEHTTGHVVAHEPFQREGRTPQQRFRLVVAFTAPDGARVRFRSIPTYGRPPYDLGSQVPVRFDPGDPSRARVNRRIELMAPLVIWGSAVCVLAGLGLAVQWFGPRGSARVPGDGHPR